MYLIKIFDTLRTDNYCIQTQLNYPCIALYKCAYHTNCTPLRYEVKYTLKQNYFYKNISKPLTHQSTLKSHSLYGRRFNTDSLLKKRNTFLTPSSHKDSSKQQFGKGANIQVQGLLP